MEKRVSCRAVVFQNNHLLAMYRNKNGNEYYTLPGGGIENNESEIECVKRECLEEFGIVVEPIKKLYILEDMKTIQNYYYCEWISGEIGTGTGEEFQEDNGKGVYIPSKLNFNELSSFPVVPQEIKERILNDYNAAENFKGDRFSTVEKVVKIETNFNG